MTCLDASKLKSPKRNSLSRDAGRVPRRGGEVPKPPAPTLAPINREKENQERGGHYFGTKKRLDLSKFCDPPAFIDKIEQEPPSPDFIGPLFRATVMTIHDRLCRWPIGVTGDDDFHFCGSNKPNDGIPYCNAHAIRAWPSKDFTCREG